MAEKRRAQQPMVAMAAVAGLGVKSTTLANIKYTRRLGELCEWIVKTDVKNSAANFVPFSAGLFAKSSVQTRTNRV